jgi:acetyl-CoA carboxylase biotin carboxylase subunit
MQRWPALRKKMGEAAVKVAKAAGYTNAGTVEFLVDRDGNFYFLEMNTRLQVEHPVTELVTGIDLVEWQLRIAAGEKLTLRQQDVTWNGSAIECRVYAEDPEQNYMPSPGKIEHLREPSGPGIRIDSGVYEGWTVPMEYDPLLAKLCAWAATRESASARLDRALAEYTLTGVRTNLAFFREILADQEFQKANLTTAFLEDFLKRRPAPADNMESEAAAAIVLALSPSSSLALAPSSAPTSNPTRKSGDSWISAAREDALR